MTRTPRLRSANSARRAEARREVAVYDGAQFLGWVIITGKSFASLDVNGRRVGVFNSQRDAIAAFCNGRPG